MKIKLVRLLLLTLSVLLLPVSLYAQTITGKVISVADGDTITILDEGKQLTKIRLYGIDTSLLIFPKVRSKRQMN